MRIVPEESQQTPTRTSATRPSPWRVSVAKCVDNESKRLSFQDSPTYLCSAPKIPLTLLTGLHVDVCDVEIWRPRPESVGNRGSDPGRQWWGSQDAVGGNVLFGSHDVPTPYDCGSGTGRPPVPSCGPHPRLGASRTESGRSGPAPRSRERAGGTRRTSRAEPSSPWTPLRALESLFRVPPQGSHGGEGGVPETGPFSKASLGPPSPASARRAVTSSMRKFGLPALFTPVERGGADRPRPKGDAASTGASRRRAGQDLGLRLSGRMSRRTYASGQGEGGGGEDARRRFSVPGGPAGPQPPLGPAGV